MTVSDLGSEVFVSIAIGVNEPNAKTFERHGLIVPQ
jgi:hypothetical protein